MENFYLEGAPKVNSSFNGPKASNRLGPGIVSKGRKLFSVTFPNGSVKTFCD